MTVVEVTYSPIIIIIHGIAAMPVCASRREDEQNDDQYA